MVIELKRLNKNFVTKHGTFQALVDIDLTVADGDIFGIIGVSGAGKSTLVRCINLLERPTSGAVLIDGVDVTGFRGRRLLDLRTKIGMVFQHFSLFDQRTALANVIFPLEIQKVDKTTARARGMELLELVGVADKATSYPSQLSGGQQQRVAIARALANNPRYLLCDEATSALDSLTTDSILELLSTINHELGVTIIVITHEMKVVQTICNKVAVIDGARIVELGETDAVFASPEQEITRRLLGQAAAEAAASEAAEALAAVSASRSRAEDDIEIDSGNRPDSGAVEPGALSAVRTLTEALDHTASVRKASTDRLDGSDKLNQLEAGDAGQAKASDPKAGERDA